MRAADLARLGSTGLRARPLRAVLSALGIAIGIAAMVAVLGVSTSSQARLNDQLDRLGTNLLRVEPGTSLSGDDVPLTPEAAGMIGRVEGVQQVAQVGSLPDVHAYRSQYINPGETNAITVQPASADLLTVTASEVKVGAWLNPATGQYPAVVLGNDAARRLGIVEPGSLVGIGDHQFVVTGILQPSPLAPELDNAALIGPDAAVSLFGWDRSPSRIYQRVDPDRMDQVRALLPSAANPQSPSTVAVSRPSDALAAKLAANQAFTGLLVGLGSIGLLVGGIGVANTMVISVLERRREIGLRRALGATRGNIRSQFLTEALLLAGLGGLAGVLLGSAATAVFAAVNGWPTVVPLVALAGGLLITVAVGGIAGFYPAMRAARTPPTAALAA